MLFLSPLLSVFGAGSPVAAQSLTWKSPAAEALLSAGIDETLNYHLAAAEAKFDSVIALEPERPEAYHYKSACYFWRFILGERQQHLERFTALAEQSLDVCDRFAARATDAKAQALGKTFAAETRFHLAAAQARAKNLVGAAMNAGKSKGLYAEALKLDAECYDAMKGAGIFEFAGSLVPPSMKWMAGILGYGGDRDRGLALITAAGEKGKYARIEARFVAAMIQFVIYKNADDAERDLVSLTKLYPNSTAFNYALGLIYYQTKATDKAKASLTKAAQDLMSGGENDFACYALFRLADIELRLNHFAEAKAHFITYQQHGNFPTYQAQTFFKLGLCCELLGQRDAAVSYFSRAQTKSDNPDELYAQRKARQYSLAPLSPATRTLWLGRNAFDAGDYKAALSELETLGAPALTDDEKAEWHYRLARCYDESGNDAKAVDSYQAATKAGAKQERMFAPFSRFHLAKLYMRQKKVDLAADEFEKAARYVSYDYDKGLQRDLIVETDKLQKLRTAP